MPCDDVEEARNSQGELFGFDRALAISREPAQKIAEQAVAFGQEDDITVVTLTLRRRRFSRGHEGRRD